MDGVPDRRLHGRGQHQQAALRVMSLRITPSNKHEPVYSREFIMEYARRGEPRTLDLLRFNKLYPTRRHWHHAVHTAARLPCDDLCKPKRTYTGGNMIERIKAKYRIEDIAAMHTKLRGNEVLSGKCFLHSGSGSEFVVWVDEQRWKCFGRCGLHGDVIDLIRALKERGLKWTTR